VVRSLVLPRATEAIHRALDHVTPWPNLFLAGRTGLFQYQMLEGCHKSGVRCAEIIRRHLDGEPPLERVSLRRDAYGRPLVVPE